MHRRNTRRFWGLRCASERRASYDGVRLCDGRCRLCRTRRGGSLVTAPRDGARTERSPRSPRLPRSPSAQGAADERVHRRNTRRFWGLRCASESRTSYDDGPRLERHAERAARRCHRRSVRDWVRVWRRVRQRKVVTRRDSTASARCVTGSSRWVTCDRTPGRGVALAKTRATERGFQFANDVRCE